MFAAVVTPRMAIDTFPDLTPPVLVVGTLAPGLGAKDVEKTLTWRIEKYVSATPGVEHVESVSRNNLSHRLRVADVGHGPRRRADARPAAGAVRDGGGAEVARRACRRSSCSTTRRTRRSCRSRCTAAGSPGPQLYDYAINNIEPLLEGIPGVASAALNGGRQRQINVVVDPARAQSRGVTVERRRGGGRAVERAAAVGRVHLAKLRRERLHQRDPARVDDIGDAIVKLVDGKAVYIRDVARVEDGGAPRRRRPSSVNGEDAVYLNVLRVPGGNTLEIVDAVKSVVASLHDLPPGMHGRSRSSTSRRSCGHVPRAQARRSCRRSCWSRS